MTAVTGYEQQLHSAAGGASRGDRELARYYRTVFGWPVVADPAGVWLRLGDVVDVLAIRTRLAVRVDHILVQSLLGTPIIEVRGQATVRIFLTRPRTPLRQSTWAELARLGIKWLELGSSLRLPPLDGTANGFHWLKCPTRGQQLPPWTAVIGAARSAATVEFDSAHRIDEEATRRTQRAS